MPSLPALLPILYMTLVTLVCVWDTVNGISDFETSTAALTATLYKSTSCWFGICSENESTTTITPTANPAAYAGPAIVPDTTTYTSGYANRDFHPVVVEDVITTSTTTPGLSFQMIPAHVLQGATFGFFVLYVDETTGKVIGKDDDGNAIRFDVTVSIGAADVVGESVDGSWILYDLILGGTKTRTMEHGVGEFTLMELNIPNTLVKLKVTGTVGGVTYTKTATEFLAVKLYNLNTVTAIDTELGVMQVRRGYEGERERS